MSVLLDVLLDIIVVVLVLSALGGIWVWLSEKRKPKQIIDMPIAPYKVELDLDLSNNEGPVQVDIPLNIQEEPPIIPSNPDTTVPVLKFPKKPKKSIKASKKPKKPTKPKK
jgi:hypothetical protein